MISGRSVQAMWRIVRSLAACLCLHKAFSLLILYDYEVKFGDSPHRAVLMVVSSTHFSNSAGRLSS